MKKKQFKVFIGLLILASGVFGSACGMDRAEAHKTESPTATVKPRATATPYKPLKRVSRDVIKTETKDETATVKTKK